MAPMTPLVIEHGESGEFRVVRFGPEQ